MKNNKFLTERTLTCLKQTLALAGLSLSLSVSASTISFSYTGSIQSWVVPETGIYRISATGAQGASGDLSYSGGRGALVEGDFNFSRGTLINLAVGGAGVGSGSGSNGGGGGGSFVVDSYDNPLLIAGGGGGTRVDVYQNGCDASVSQFGGEGSGPEATSSCSLKASGLGLGGSDGSTDWGAGGAGFYGDGDDNNVYGSGGSSWLNGLFGGQVNETCGVDATGGFGGGGAGNGCFGGGGGGGYSGGDGGRLAGGGGSFNAGDNPFSLAGQGFGDGALEISMVSSVPIPAAAWLFGSALAGLGVLRRKK